MLVCFSAPRSTFWRFINYLKDLFVLFVHFGGPWDPNVELRALLCHSCWTIFKLVVLRGTFGVSLLILGLRLGASVVLLYGSGAGPWIPFRIFGKSFPALTLGSDVFRGSGVIMLQDLKVRPAAPMEAFARFQAGFLASEDFYRIPSIFI